MLVELKSIDPVGSRTKEMRARDTNLLRSTGYPRRAFASDAAKKPPKPKYAAEPSRVMTEIKKIYGEDI
jgi:hypothetical protein